MSHDMADVVDVPVIDHQEQSINPFVEPTPRVDLRECPCALENDQGTGPNGNMMLPNYNRINIHYATY
jgi:hypothetical protein